MNYRLLTPKDQSRETWVVFEIDERRRLREKYQHLRCLGCGKIDEWKALELGVDHNVVVNGNGDYLNSADGFIFLSRRLVDVFRSHGIDGFAEIILPGDSRYVIAKPTCLVRTDLAKAGIEIHGPVCDICSRPRETCFLPTLSSMQLPPNPFTLFASEIWAESSFGRDSWFTASQSVVDIMKRETMKAVEYDDPY